MKNQVGTIKVVYFYLHKVDKQAKLNNILLRDIYMGSKIIKKMFNTKSRKVVCLPMRVREGDAIGKGYCGSSKVLVKFYFLS